MSRPTRATPAGRAYLDLQNRARREKRGTQELLTLYVVERWLARLSVSAYADQFVLKGGMLLAAFDARRPTADADTLARHIPHDEATLLAGVTAVAREPVADDGVMFHTDTASARTIRDEALYSGLRITMTATLATATVKFHLDVNFGDPITPPPRRIRLPALRADAEPIVIFGYPIETVLAEKITTAIALGDANTRIRDYTDIYTLTGRHNVTRDTMRQALLTTAEFRGTTLEPLSAVLDELTDLRGATYTAYRTRLGTDGNHLPRSFADVVTAVTTFTDPLTQPAATNPTWNATHRHWNGTSR
ncbi:MAG: nucleotidyl transferase AbiEii/AbiGii toxin family protein [Nocardioidaceae bacterium]